MRKGGLTEEDENQPNVSPPIFEPDIQRGVILVSNRERTISAKRGLGGIVQVTAEVLNEIIGPGRARLAQRWVEDREFFRVAGDFETAGKTEDRR